MMIQIGSEIFSGTLDVLPFVILICGFILLGQSVFFHHPGKPGRLLKVWAAFGLMMISGFIIILGV